MDSHETRTPTQRRAWGTFALAFVAVFVVTFGALSLMGIVPVPKVEDVVDAVAGGGSASAVEHPVRIEALSIGLSRSVLNPQSADVEVLDQNLLRGAVRYPGSALLGEEGNVLIFGHSSYLPVVSNDSYKAFNGIQNLKTGAIISVSSKDAVYDYRVTSVRFSKAEEGVIDLSRSGKKLTLVTCNSFKTKSDRFVVEAEFVEKRAL